MRRFVAGERIALRKAHPCGATTWVVDRVGADIGVTCDGCGRRLVVERRELEARLVPGTPR